MAGADWASAHLVRAPEPYVTLPALERGADPLAAIRLRKPPRTPRTRR